MKHIDKDTKFAFILCVVFILMSGAILVWGIGDGEAPTGCFTCIFEAAEESQAEETNITGCPVDYHDQTKGD
jgi:hypothetical protein